MAIPVPTTITVSSKGQIALPKEFRVAAGLEVGTKIILECLPDGTLELHPLHYSIHEIFGAGKKWLGRNKKISDDFGILLTVAEEDDATKKKRKLPHDFRRH
jgi:AbrB family looped-hinge helix DNA binding protein